MTELDNIRSQWERVDEKIVSEIDHEGTVLVIMKVNDAYTLMRYFQIRGTWMASCDVAAASADEVFKFLNKVIS